MKIMRIVAALLILILIGVMGVILYAKTPYNPSLNVFTDPKKQYSFLYPKYLTPSDDAGVTTGSFYEIGFYDKSKKTSDIHSYRFDILKIPGTIATGENLDRTFSKYNPIISITKIIINGNQAEFIKVGVHDFYVVDYFVQGNGYVVKFRNDTFYTPKDAPKIERYMLGIVSTFKQTGQ